MRAQLRASTRVSTVAAAACVAVLAGCGPVSGQAGSEPGPTSSARPSLGTTEPDLQPTPTTPAAKPSGKLVRVTGVVTPGVEAGCRLLTSGGTTYLLLGQRAQIPLGERVTVVGEVAEGLMTTCQQGVPLRIQRVSHT